MLRKLNLMLLPLALTLMLLLAGNAMAACEFTVDGTKLLCPTCSCAELKDADVKMENCIDWLARSRPPTPKRYDKILRYSDFVVTLHSPNGKESPLASDASQKQFDEMHDQFNFRELVTNFKPAAGIISVARVEGLARDLGVPVVDVKGRPGPNTGQSDPPKFEVGPQFSFLSLNRPQSIIVGHGDSQGIIGHMDNNGIVGHTDCGGIIGHTDQQGIIGHTDGGGIVGHQDCGGIGVRFTYNATRNVALEAAGNFFPKISPDFFLPGENIIGHMDVGGIVGHSDASGFQLQFGAKIGKRFGKFGIFGKARPGLIRFSEGNRLIGTETIPSNAGLPATVVGVFSRESKTYFSTDVGGVVEYYPSRPIVIRFDLGDTIIRYGTRSGLSLSGTIIQLPAEAKHNLQFSAGIGFRF